MEYIPCIGNSSYSFWRILLKLYSCFQDGLKICILFSQDPEIIFFLHFNLDIFSSLLLQICIGSICLVSATQPTVLGQSFWNFTGTLQLSFDFTWEICHLLDITAVAGHLAWLAVFIVCCLAHRGSTVGFLLLQCSSGVVRHPRDLQVSVATHFCRVLIFASS